MAYQILFCWSVLLVILVVILISKLGKAHCQQRQLESEQQQLKRELLLLKIDYKNSIELFNFYAIIAYLDQHNQIKLEIRTTNPDQLAVTIGQMALRGCHDFKYELVKCGFRRENIMEKVPFIPDEKMEEKNCRIQKYRLSDIYLDDINHQPKPGELK